MNFIKEQYYYLLMLLKECPYFSVRTRVQISTQCGALVCPQYLSTLSVMWFNPLKD